MKTALTPRLVNRPFGDPGLYVAMRWQGRAIQFDLGRLGRMPAADILKLSHVFVSHAHMDHFMGFDHLLRVFLNRDTRLELFGPAGFLDRIEARLGGYTWNLTEEYGFEILGHEVHPERITTALFRASTGFERDPGDERPFTGRLLDDPTFTVDTAILDHKIPCLAFAITERSHLNVDTEGLAALGLKPGRWLNQLKDAIREGSADDTPIAVVGTSGDDTMPLGALRKALVRETAGQKVGYVVDTLFSEGNRAQISELVADATVFYCEAPFLDEDVDQATKRYHLTAKQAGTLARDARAKRLEVFHFSPRYEGQAPRIYEEARLAFQGE